MIVPTRRPPIMDTAIGPNIASEIRGIIPRIVVPEAIITGLNLDEEADNRASTGSTPVLI